ncbi:unnamed protein product [Lymnaea stagnalis]|uniref:Zinc finger CCHC domain-containing protein 10 n=1 Tax=Lymnaea stagnalis TaxID=6523 RepID=A0AAV2HN25_LYMST
MANFPMRLPFENKHNKNLVKQESYQCQKCLQKGHFTYQCTGKRKYVERDSRTRLLNKRIKMEDEKAKLEMLAKSTTVTQKKHTKDKKKRKKSSDGDSSSTSSSSDSSEDSSSDSSDDSSSDSDDSSSSSESSSSSATSSSDSSSDSEPDLQCFRLSARWTIFFKTKSSNANAKNVKFDCCNLDCCCGCVYDYVTYVLQDDLLNVTCVT